MRFVLLFICVSLVAGFSNSSIAQDKFNQTSEVTALEQDYENCIKAGALKAQSMKTAELRGKMLTGKTRVCKRMLTNKLKLLKTQNINAKLKREIAELQRKEDELDRDIAELQRQQKEQVLKKMASEARIRDMTNDLIDGAKKELGIDK